MKRAKRQTKRERKAHDPNYRPGTQTQNQHIHCVACGRHIDPSEFEASPATATTIVCDHGSRFPACTTCLHDAQKLVDEHDRSGQPVKTASAWH